MEVSELWIYPIKSCRGISLSEVELDAKGFKYDRRFMFVDHNGEMLTQRKQHRMSGIECQILNDKLKIRASNFQQIEIPLIPQEGSKIKAKVWSSVCDSLKVSHEADQWISDFLGFQSSLVYMPDKTKRIVDTHYNTTNATTTFTDGFPILLISQASLDDLNSRMSTPVPMNRFRPNLVVSGFKPFQEDDISEFQINGLRFAVKKPCARCMIPTINQSTGEKGKEPMKTLSTFRMKDNNVYFGQNVIHLDRKGRFKVGDQVII